MASLSCFIFIIFFIRSTMQGPEVISEKSDNNCVYGGVPTRRSNNECGIRGGREYGCLHLTFVNSGISELIYTPE